MRPWTHVSPLDWMPSWAHKWYRPACNGALVAHVEHHRRDKRRGVRNFSVAICGGDPSAADANAAALRGEPGGPVEVWICTRVTPGCYFATLEEAQAHADVLEAAVVAFARRIVGGGKA